MIKVELPKEYVQTAPKNVSSGDLYEYPGVYVFFGKNDTALYVGKTKNFRSRFSGHRANNTFYYDSEYVRLYHVKNEYERDVYETTAIQELKPIHNRGKVYFRRKELEERISDIDDEIHEKIEEVDDLKLEINDIYDDYSDDEEYDAGAGDLFSLQARTKAIEYELRELRNEKRATAIRYNL